MPPSIGTAISAVAQPAEEARSMRPTARLSFESPPSGTRLTIRARSNVPTLLKPLEGLANRMGKREWDDRLQRIRADLESGS